jgi:DNA-binding transcriptional MocR family regulator
MKKADQIFNTLLRQIKQGSLNPGMRLPAIRKSAEDFNVSKNTVVNAYDRLVAGDYISAKQGSGFVVNSTKPALTEMKPTHVKEAGDIIGLLHAQLDKEYSIRVGDGRPPASWMDGITSGRPPTASISNNMNDNSGYGSALGYLGLRENIAARHQMQNIDIIPNQIVMTLGANHALDMIIRRLLSPGDTVLVDDPGYYPLFAKLKISKINFVGVKRTSTGPDLVDLELKMEQLKPSIFFTQSTAQNPTGSSMDLKTAHGVLQIAALHSCLVVDDDPFIDLPNVSGFRMAALDGFKNMIYVGSYSKTLSASFRSGYIIAHPELAASLAEFKMITAVNSSRYCEMIITDLINTRRFQKHLNKFSERVSNASLQVAKKLTELGYELFCTPTNGYYIYMKLPENVNDLEIARTAAQKGIFLAPGSLFSVEPKEQPPNLRINVTRADDSRFYSFLKSHAPTK